MFHYLSGAMQSHDQQHYLIHDRVGVMVTYQWSHTHGDFWLHPHLDDTTKTITYFAFDVLPQKALFLSVLKISGIWPKTAYALSRLDRDALQQAVEQVDVKFFQSLPGIGPKTAKRLVIELKHSVLQSDFQKIDIDTKLFKDIVKTMKSVGYDTTTIQSLLRRCPVTLHPEHLSAIIKRLMDQIKP